MYTHLVAMLMTSVALAVASYPSSFSSSDPAGGRAGDGPSADAPMVLALELGQLGDDTQQDERRFRMRGNSERVFGPVHPTSRLGTYTGRGLGSYTGRGLGSYTGSGLGGSTTMGIGNANGMGTRNDGLR